MIVFLRKLSGEIVACATPHFFKRVITFFIIISISMSITLAAQYIQILQQDKDIAILNLLLNI